MIKCGNIRMPQHHWWNLMAEMSHLEMKHFLPFPEHSEGPWTAQVSAVNQEQSNCCPPGHRHCYLGQGGGSQAQFVDYWCCRVQRAKPRCGVSAAGSDGATGIDPQPTAQSCLYLQILKPHIPRKTFKSLEKPSTWQCFPSRAVTGTKRKQLEERMRSNPWRKTMLLLQQFLLLYFCAGVQEGLILQFSMLRPLSARCRRVPITQLHSSKCHFSDSH